MSEAPLTGPRIDWPALADLAETVKASDARANYSEELRHRLLFALETLEATVNVRTRERVHVADMQPFGRRVGKHHEVIERLRRRVQPLLCKGVRAALSPAGLPLLFDQMKRILSARLRHKGQILEKRRAEAITSLS